MKEFLCGVANVNLYDASDNLLVTSKTLIDSSLTASTKMTEIRGGQQDKLEFQYFYGSDLKFTLTESQFSLGMISNALGSSLVTGSPIWQTDVVTLGAGGTGAVTQTPIATTSGNIYGWVSDTNNNQLGRVTFTSQNFTLAGGTSGQVVNVRYYTNSASAQSMTVNSAILPNVVHAVLDAQLFSGDTTNASPLIGKIFIDVPKLQLDGNVKLDLKSSGVSNTPLAGSALDSNGVYATITQNIFANNWYTGVGSLAVVPSAPTLSLSGTKTVQLNTYAVPTDGRAAFLVSPSNLTYTSGTPATASVSASGLVTGLVTGTTLISVVATGVTPTLEVFSDVTVTA